MVFQDLIDKSRDQVDKGDFKAAQVLLDEAEEVYIGVSPPVSVWSV